MSASAPATAVASDSVAVSAASDAGASAAARQAAHEMSRKVTRSALVVVVIVAVGATAVWLGWRKGSSASTNTSAATSRVLTVQPTTMDQTISTSGTIQPSDTENLSFATSGTVQAVSVEAGQKVKKGQVLATVSAPALASSLAQAQATLASAQAQLSSDQSASASTAQI